MAAISYIALIDDHTLLRNGLAGIINSFERYKVLLEADNGKDFIDKVKLRHAPDIILLDITMPVMNGFETAEWIRVNLPLSKVIVLSMMDHDVAIIRMLRSGAKGYILKDSKPSVLLQALNAVRDVGFYTNELVSSRMWHYIGREPEKIDNTSLLSSITERELVFLKLCCTDKTYREIADEMFVSPRTIDSYRDSLFEKFNVNSRVGLVLFALKYGLVTL